jgi:hypothetical protein
MKLFNVKKYRNVPQKCGFCPEMFTEGYVSKKLLIHIVEPNIISHELLYLCKKCYAELLKEMEESK